MNLCRYCKAALSRNTHLGLCSVCYKRCRCPVCDSLTDKPTRYRCQECAVALKAFTETYGQLCQGESGFSPAGEEREQRLALYEWRMRWNVVLKEEKSIFSNPKEVFNG